MAKYLILIYGDDRQWAAMSAPEIAEVTAGHLAFRTKAGTALLSGEQLQPPNTATTLRTRGRLAATDGPFLETKEGLGGFYLVQAADLDEVTALCELLREVHVGHSGVEIRPVVDHG